MTTAFIPVATAARSQTYQRVAAELTCEGRKEMYTAERERRTTDAPQLCDKLFLNFRVSGHTVQDGGGSGASGLVARTHDIMNILPQFFICELAAIFWVD
jgi:hypothetical protein